MKISLSKITKGPLPTMAAGDQGTSRTNLGLGDSATKNVGTGAGTVAAGDHGHSGYAASGANADITSLSAAAVYDKGGAVHNVKAYGAVGDGSTDDTTAINNAIAALGANGGVVYFPPGTYKITSTIYLGDGSAGGVSTQQMIRLVGAGTSRYAGNQGATTELKWYGSAGGTLMQVRGPIIGVEIGHMRLHGNSLAGVGLSIIASVGGWFHDLDIGNGQSNSVGMVWDTVDHAEGGNGNNAVDRVVIIQQASGASALKVGLTGVAGTTYRAGTSRTVFSNCDFFYAGNVDASYGIYLKNADNNTFIESMAVKNSGETLGYAVYFDQLPAPDTGFPGGNVFINVSMNGGSRSVGGTSGTGGNIFLPYPNGDGESVPTDVANLAGFKIGTGIGAFGDLGLRGTMSVFFLGNLTGSFTAARWNNSKPIVITRVTAVVKTPPSGNTTQAVIRVAGSGGSNIDITITGYINDSGAISNTYNAGSIDTSLQIGAAGGTLPADCNVIVEYRIR